LVRRERSVVPVPELSQTEERIVVLARGRSRREIAAVVGLDVRTVDWQLVQANRKLEKASALLDSSPRKREEVMTNFKAIFGLLLAVVAAVGVVAFGAAQASASSAPIVIPYEKTCIGLTCEGTANGVTIVMQVDPATFRETGSARQFTLTESITVGDISFTAVMNAHRSPDGFIVLNGTVTEGSFAGAQVHQRSDLVGIDGNISEWTGELRLMPASA
jgi:hypothetical protein